MPTEPTIILSCCRCPSKLPLFIDLAGVSDTEYWGVATAPAAAHGWAIRRDLVHVESICPACIKAEAEQPLVVLAAYSGETACPKCRERWIKTRFCMGMTAGCPVVIRREHLHRTCETCGFDWIEAPADTPKEKKRSWMERAYAKMRNN